MKAIRTTIPKTLVSLVLSLTLIGVFLPGNVLGNTPPADGVSCLDEFHYAWMQLNAVTLDMFRYLGWMFEEKELMKEAAVKALEDLGEIESRLQTVDCPDDMKYLKKLGLDLVRESKAIYAGIEEKDESMIKSEFEAISDLFTEYDQLLEQKYTDSLGTDELEDESKQTAEELRWLEDEEAKELYQKAIDLMAEKEYERASFILSELLKKYTGSPAGAHVIMMKLSDSLLMFRGGKGKEKVFDALDHTGANEYGLNLLSDIVESNIYSPVICDAFYKWRTTEQQTNHGMSNYSEIPNKEYNEKRMHVINVVKQYLAKNPDDRWAKAQLNWLWSLPNIKPGGEYGNTNLILWAMIYTDILSKKDGEADKQPEE